MAGELLKVTAGIDMLHVPYKNSAAARADIMGGQVDVMFDALPAMVSNIKAGKVIGLATTGLVRSAVLPELATVRESGYPDFEATIWNGIMAPKGTPAAVVAKLNAEIRRIVSSPELVKSWAAQGVIPMSMGPAEFERMMDDDIAKWAQVVKRSGVKLEQ